MSKEEEKIDSEQSVERFDEQESKPFKNLFNTQKETFHRKSKYMRQLQ